MYSTFNEGNSVVAERNQNLQAHDTSIKNVYFDFLDDIVDEYNNTYYKTIKMKSIDVRSDSFAEYNEEFNSEYPSMK